MDFHRRYPGRIVPLLRDHNLGGARNFCDTLASCQGQYVAMLDGDDYWTSEDKLQRQVDFLDAQRDYALCCHRAQLLDDMGTGRTGLWPSLTAGSYGIREVLHDNFVLPTAAVCRRDSIGPLPPWLSTMEHADWALFALIAQRGRILLMDDVMAMYRIHPGAGWSARPDIDRRRESMRMLKALDKHLGFQYTSAIRRPIARCHLHMASIARQEGNRAQTAKHLAGYLRNGGLKVASSRRAFASFTAYTLFGSWYEAIRKARRGSHD